MLTAEQQNNLHLSILSFFVERGGTLAMLVGLELSGRAPMRPTNDIAARFVIEECLANIDLLHHVLWTLDPLAVSVQLQSIRTLAKNWQPSPSQDMFLCLELSDGPFVDRDNLRQGLRSLLDRDSEPILVVNGELGMGKSYSTQMIAEDAAQHADLHVVRLKAEPSSASIWEIEDVASEIVQHLSIQQHQVPPSHAVQSDRLAGLLADWTADEIAHSGDTVWIVLDGFDHPDVPTETGKYIDELLAMVGGDSRFERTRIVLFAFDVKRLDSLTNRYTSHVLEVPDNKEILEYFKARYPSLPNYYWETAATIAMENVPNGGPSCMPKIQLNVRKATNVLARSV